MCVRTYVQTYVRTWRADVSTPYRACALEAGEAAGEGRAAGGPLAASGVVRTAHALFLLREVRSVAPFAAVAAGRA